MASNVMRTKSNNTHQRITRKNPFPVGRLHVVQPKLLLRISPSVARLCGKPLRHVREGDEIWIFGKGAKKKTTCQSKIRRIYKIVSLHV